MMPILGFLGMSTPQIWTIGGIVFLALVIVVIIKALANCYVRVAPNEVLVKYGRQYRRPDGSTDGFKLVAGGASFVIPLLEKCQILPLDAFQVPVSVKNVPSEQGVRVTVASVASLKIGSEHAQLDAAVRRFLKKNTEEISQFAQQVLEGGLRGVVATMTVEALVKERAVFGSKVQEQVTQDLAKFGLVVDNFVIQEISDENGYIAALGVAQTAAIKRDAAIAQADADRDQTIRVAEAQRDAAQKSAEAKRIGETAKAQADQSISDAQKARDVQIASNAAEVKAKQIQIEIAAKIAAANRDKELRTSLVAAEQAEVEARTRLQAEEKKRHDAELEAGVIVQANREREARLIAADAQKQASVITAEGVKQAAILTAEGQRKQIEELAAAEQAKRTREATGLMEAEKQTAEGRKAQAAATQAELVAAANGRQAGLVAEAEGTKAKLLAEAEGQKANLLAVAAGIAEKAKAYKELEATGKLLEVLKAAPEVVAAIGAAIKQAGEGTLVPMSQAIGQGLGNIDELRIVDLGGSGGQSGNDPVSKFVGMIQKSLFDVVQKANGMPGTADAIKGALKKVGIDLDTVIAANPGSGSVGVAPTAPAATPTAPAAPAGGLKKV